MNDKLTKNQRNKFKKIKCNNDFVNYRVVFNDLNWESENVTIYIEDLFYLTKEIK